MEKWKIIHIYNIYIYNKNETKGHPTPRPTQPHKRLHIRGLS